MHFPFCEIYVLYVKFTTQNSEEWHINTELWLLICILKNLGEKDTENALKTGVAGWVEWELELRLDTR